MEDVKFTLPLILKCFRKILKSYISLEVMLRSMLVVLLLPLLILAEYYDSVATSELFGLFTEEQFNAQKLLNYILKVFYISLFKCVMISAIDVLYAPVKRIFFIHGLSDYLSIPYEKFKSFVLGDLMKEQFEKGDAGGKIMYKIIIHTVKYVSLAVLIIRKLSEKGGLWFTLSLVFGTLVYLTIYVLSLRRLNGLQNRALVAKLKGVSTVFNESNNFEIIKTFGNEVESVKRAENHFNTYSIKQIALDTFQERIVFASMVLELSSTIILFQLFLSDVITERKDVFEKAALIVELYDYVRKLLNKISETNLLFTIYYILELKLDEEKRREAVLETIDEIEITDLSFEGVFSEVNAVIRKNEKIALYGSNESGKTTFLNMLAGLLPSGEEIKLNGNPLSQINRKDLYSKLVLVTQRAIYKQGTVLENLRIGNSLTKEEIIEKCKEFRMDEMFSSFENGYDKVSETSGTGLSVGQRQRVNFMRGVLRDSEILLVDDAFYGINTADKVFIVKKLLEMEDKTVVLVTNDFDSLHKFDKVLYLNGKKSKFGAFEAIRHEIV